MAKKQKKKPESHICYLCDKPIEMRNMSSYRRGDGVNYIFMWSA